jgi:hypothetical protein
MPIVKINRVWDQGQKPKSYRIPHRKALWIVLLLAVLLPHSAANACSSEDRAELAQEGYTSDQIDAQCGSGGNPFVTPSMPTASMCTTQVGTCYLGAQATVGDQCWCQTGYGNVIAGVAR